MTLGEFKLKFGHLPDDTPIAVYLSNGNLDYASGGWESPPDENEAKETTIVISGN